MILRELFYADNDLRALSSDMRYEPDHDTSVVHRKDTRKTRLSLKQINQLRKASEQHDIEEEKELEFVQRMYKTETPAPTI